MHTYFSTPVEWVKLDKHLALFGKTVKRAAGDGMCFVEAVREGLKDAGEKESDREVLKATISNEMYNHIHFYADFHPTGKHPQQLLLDAENFSENKGYTMDVVDVCIAATANATGYNLYIYEKLGDQAVIRQEWYTLETIPNGIFLH